MDAALQQKGMESMSNMPKQMSKKPVMESLTSEDWLGVAYDMVNPMQDVVGSLFSAFNILNPF